MTELLTAAQMRAIEQAAIASGEVTGLELMERAGQGVVDAILDEWPAYRTAPQSAVVLCGPGNNGGDGFVVARLLRELNWGVTVYLYGDADRLPPDARVNYDRWGGALATDPLTEEAFRRGPGAAIYVDALFGAGLNRRPEGDLASFLQYLGGSGGDYGHYHPRLVAVDAPSGLCLDSGRMLGGGGPWPFESSVPLVRLTVTFDSPKIGHFIGDGPACCGALKVVDIGIAKWRETHKPPGFPSAPIRPVQTGLVVRVPLVEDQRHRLFGLDVRWPSAKGPGHKYRHGHALILSGGCGQGGAARLSARAALRVGAGLVTVGCPPAALQENAARLDAVMLKSVKDPDALAALLADARINALCLGPGMGITDRTRSMVEVALAADRATLLDADALTVFEDDADALFDLLHDRCVLTPHMGEFARLFPDIADTLRAKPQTGPAYSKLDATRAAAERAGCTVLLKGADTVIASPGGRAFVHASMYEREAPWLATAGSGDVLAGLITGLLARGSAPATAAAFASWLHTECALEFGPGLIAEDLPEMVPRVLRRLA
ncbi:MAG: NAD(P)H-hydrate dehydratase [Pseudomonadota bacterium]